MKLNVPYYSQRTDVVEPEWRAHSCLVISAKMVAEFLGIKKIPADDWIKEGTYIGAYDGKFWKHEGVVRLLRNHGLFAYAQEFKTVDVDIKSGDMNESKLSEEFEQKGIEKIIKKLDEGIPSIVSIFKYFTEKDRHHAIVIIGFDMDAEGKVKGLYYHDPEMKEEGGGKDLYVEIDKFVNGWKKLAIFLEKENTG
jgi:hypothetical protein